MSRSATPKLHPCQSCGACCAYFRVSFYWRESLEPAKGSGGPAVPPALTEPSGPFTLCMKGTNEKHHARCVALEGRVGERVGCTIYEVRPTPCREFGASFEEGRRQSRCDEARQRHGLRPLRREDWGGLPEEEVRAFPRGESVAILPP